MMNCSIDAQSKDRGNVVTLLQELSLRVERLLNHGESGCVDLGRAHLDVSRRRQLREALGRGKVSAVTSALGMIRIEETAIGGVWWISHHDRQGNLLVELIEIARYPSILEAQTQDIRRGLRQLADLSDAPPAPLPGNLSWRLQALGLEAAKPLSSVSR